MHARPADPQYLGNGRGPHAIRLHLACRIGLPLRGWGGFRLGDALGQAMVPACASDDAVPATAIRIEQDIALLAHAGAPTVEHFLACKQAAEPLACRVRHGLGAVEHGDLCVAGACALAHPLPAWTYVQP